MESSGVRCKNGTGARGSGDARGYGRDRRSVVRNLNRRPGRNRGRCEKNHAGENKLQGGKVIRGRGLSRSTKRGLKSRGRAEKRLQAGCTEQGRRRENRRGKSYKTRKNRRRGFL